MADKGSPSNVYYPVPVHLQKGYAGYGMKEGDLPTTESLTAQVLSLPIHTELTTDQLEYITKNIIKFVTE